MVVDVGTTFVHNLGVCYFLSGRHRRSHRRTDITTNRIDATRESTSRIPRGPNNGLPSTIMSWYARTETRIDTTRATTSCRPRGPCIWYAFYDNVVLYLVCTYVARIAEPIGGPQPKGWEGGRGGKAQRTIHQMEGSGSKRSRRIAEPARNKTNNATSSSKKRIAAAPYIVLDWPQLVTLAIHILQSFGVDSTILVHTTNEDRWRGAKLPRNKYYFSTDLAHVRACARCSGVSAARRSSCPQPPRRALPGHAASHASTPGPGPMCVYVRVCVGMLLSRIFPHARAVQQYTVGVKKRTHSHTHTHAHTCASIKNRLGKTVSMHAHKQTHTGMHGHTHTHDTIRFVVMSMTFCVDPKLAHAQIVHESCRALFFDIRRPSVHAVFCSCAFAWRSCKWWRPLRILGSHGPLEAKSLVWGL